ncbi:MAG: ABC transporter permease subunit [Treponema sp.]|jgi:putative aldouronate transport system permease protein|nr:ABC transporter permease subunit [Treponema sp.]
MKAKNGVQSLFRDNWRLYVLVLPALAWLGVFAYAPMYGLTIAFKNFRPRSGITGSPWAQPLFKHFIDFFSTNIAFNTISNTIILSLLTILISFPVPIIFAILLNQIKGRGPRKAIQTISYAPYFISTVVVVSILTVILSPGSGFVNTIVTAVTGGEPVLFMTRPEYFRPIYIISNIWQSMGFSAIIYIAALTSISPDYYEAAIVDGATKFQRIIHIDIPFIIPTAIIMFILAIGNIMTVGYEKVYLMQNGMNTIVSEVISTYVYKTGLQSAQYSFATAVGLFNSGVNFIILALCNTIAKKTSDISIF